MTKQTDKIQEFTKQHPNKKLLLVIQTGSHLFKLNTEKSDIDMVGIYLPEKAEFIKKSFSKEFVLNTNKTKTKNDSNDVDCKFISAFRFIDLLKTGEFNALEWLYSPDYSHIYKDPLWDLYFGNIKDNLVIFNVSSFLGFIKREYKKAGFKGNIVEEMNQVYDMLKKEDPNQTLIQIEPKLKEFSFIKFKETKIDNSGKTKTIPTVILGERMFQTSFKISYVIKELESILNSQISSHRKDETGLDLKGLYHSQRLLVEAKSLLSDRKLQIPFSTEDHEYLMNIRKGLIPIDELRDKIESDIELVKSLEKNVINTNYNLHNLDKLYFTLFGRLNIQARLP
jgi:hypothetical protein